MHTDKSCRECGQTLQGRADKKFCDDQCRSNFNNRIYSDYDVGMRNINSILRRNRRILIAMVKAEGKAKVPKVKLADKGFNFRFFTHTYTTRRGTEYRLCYDYGYMPVENDYVLVVKWGGE